MTKTEVFDEFAPSFATHVSRPVYTPTYAGIKGIDIFRWILVRRRFA
jgi:hypothetical protein